jgi:hypothetical protein
MDILLSEWSIHQEETDCRSLAHREIERLKEGNRVGSVRERERERESDAAAGKRKRGCAQR